jgi:hypothetical protein
MIIQHLKVFEYVHKHNNHMKSSDAAVTVTVASQGADSPWFIVRSSDTQQGVRVYIQGKYLVGLLNFSFYSVNIVFST